jgi:signal transduction histidine kinase
MTSSPIDAAWRHSPWAIAALSDHGTVRGVNPAFERCTGIAPETALGMSAADFAAQLDALPLDACRVETTDGCLSAIYYLRPLNESSVQTLELARLTETLREPLASIYGFAELLLTQNYDEETRRDLTATLLEQVEAITNIINAQ